MDAPVCATSCLCDVCRVLLIACVVSIHPSAVGLKLFYITLIIKQTSWHEFCT